MSDKNIKTCTPVFALLHGVCQLVMCGHIGTCPGLERDSPGCLLEGVLVPVTLLPRHLYLALEVVDLYPLLGQLTL